MEQIKVSELIYKLQKTLEKHGDKPVVLYDEDKGVFLELTAVEVDEYGEEENAIICGSRYV